MKKPTSQYYDSETVHMKPEHDQEYQLAEQQWMAQDDGTRAVRSNAGLKQQFLDKRVSKMMRLKELGMRKKEGEARIDLGRERLALDDKRLDLARKKRNWRRDSDRTSTFLSLGNMALSAGVGWMQYKEAQKQGRAYDNMLNFFMDRKEKKYYRGDGSDPVGE